MSGGENYEVIQEQDRFLPIANVARIMKRVVPPSGKLSKESKECVQECVSEFIQFIVSEASERCTTEKRKTITCEDLLQAFSALSFDPYVDVLKAYIERYRQSAKSTSGPTPENQQQSTSCKTEPPKPSTPNETESDASALQPVQMYVDQNGQHFMTVQYPDGTNALVPVNLINPES